MESVDFINHIFLFVVHVLFFFSGICLNSLVIISFWRSVQLRKKLCYFMIMVLSCFDLLAVLINNLWLAVLVMLSITGKLDVNAAWPHTVSRVTAIFQAFSLLALLIMNFDRYLAISYPLFHRTSITKKKYLTFFAILNIIEVCSALMSINDYVISFRLHYVILFGFVSPPMLFFNFKLLVAVRKSRANNRRAPMVKKAFSIKNISSCLLAVACYLALSIPVFVFVGLRMNYAKTALNLDHDVYVIMAWCVTISSMNSTFNCLIFYWKNKVLRTEGLKVIKSIKIWRLVQF